MYTASQIEEMRRHYHIYRRMMWMNDIRNRYDMPEEYVEKLCSFLMDKYDDEPDMRNELIDDCMRETCLDIDYERRKA